jgi:hypothetical protein
MPASIRSLGFQAVVALFGACATAELRTARPEERNRVTDVFTLLVSAAYGGEAAACHVATGVLEADTLDVWIRAELGHVWSRHPVGRARRGQIQGSRTDSGQRATLTTGGQEPQAVGAVAIADPFPERRVDAVVNACAAGQRRP